VRWLVPVLVAAAVLGGGVALFAARGDDDEPPPAAGTQQDAFTITDEVDRTDEPEPSETAPRPQRTAVETAALRYIEAAEAGEVAGDGLPTSDEASIEKVRIRGRRALVTLVGGARLWLRKDGSWAVVRISAPTPEPTPPSGPP
jgi:hypothetical protein